MLRALALALGARRAGTANGVSCTVGETSPAHEDSVSAAFIVVTITTPAADTALAVNVPIAVTGTSTVDGAYDILIDGTVRGSGTCTGGTLTGTVTAVAGDVGTGATLSIRESGGSVDRATRSVDVIQLLGWWPTDAVDGNVTVSDGTTSLEISAWDKTDCTAPNSVSDPDGGSSAYSMTENAGAGVTGHFLREHTTGTIDTYCAIEVWLKQKSRRYVNARWGTLAGGQEFFVDLQTQTGVSVPAGSSVSVLDSVGSWHKYHIYWKHAAATAQHVFHSANDTPSYTFDAGAGVNAFDIYHPVLVQTHAQQVDDQSGGTADITQVTLSNRFLFWDDVAAESGVVLLGQESGRATSLATTNATVTSALTSSKCPYAVIFGCATLTDGARLYHETVAGGGAHFTRSGANLVYTRADGVDSRTFTFAGAGTAIASAKSVLLAGLPDGSCTLWLGASKYAGSAAGTEPTGMTVTAFSVGSTITNEMACSGPMLIDTTGWGGTADELEASLRALRAHEAAKYGLAVV